MTMRRLTVMLLICLLVLSLLLACSPKPKPTAGPTLAPTAAAVQPAFLENLATRFVDRLVAEDYTNAVANFDVTMAGLLPPDKLKETWQALLGQVGAYKKQLGTRFEKVQGFDTFYVTCEFEKAKIDVKVVFSGTQISGLWFEPAKTSYEYAPPAYAKVNLFTETEVQVGSGEWVLPGTLTLPVSGRPFCRRGADPRLGA